MYILCFGEVGHPRKLNFFFTFLKKSFDVLREFSDVLYFSLLFFRNPLLSLSNLLVSFTCLKKSLISLRDPLVSIRLLKKSFAFL